MKRAIFTILAVAVVVNLGWLAFIVHDLRTNQVRTKATVIDVSPCNYQTRQSLGTNYCPTFTYRDSSGKSHQVASTEGFDSFNKPFLGVKVGDTRTMWYEKSKPSESYIAYGLAMLSVWVLPLIIGIIVCVIIAAAKFVNRTRNKPVNGVRYGR